jgi:flagellar basal body P-ring formation protein FlgA
MKHLVHAFCILVCLNSQANSGTLTATHNIRSGQLIGIEDVHVGLDQSLGGLSNPNDIIGLQAKTNIFRGTVILPSMIGRPTLVERNQLVNLVFLNAALRIETQGRALGRGSIGESVPVLNISSKKTVQGTIQNDGSILVDGSTFNNVITQ